jgi:hypothetical protein
MCCGVFVCKVYEGGELTIEFDFECTLIGNEADFIDEGTDGFGGFGLEKSPSTQLTPLAPIKPDGCHE